MALVRHAAGEHAAGRLESAIDAYRAVLERRPDLAEGWFYLGNALDQAGRDEDCLAAYRQALSLRPDYAKPWVNLGVVLRRQGRIEASEEALRQAVALAPDMAEAQLNLGLTLFDKRRPADAIPVLERACRLQPDNGAAHHYLAVARAAGSDPRGAVAAARRAVGCADFPEAHFTLFSLLRANGGGEAEALERCEAAVAAQPQSPQLCHVLARIRLELGLIEAAVAGLGAALPFLPPDHEARRLLERMTTGPSFPASGIQGSQAPARQIYMAAAVERKRGEGRPPRILEVGSYMGASTYTWASAAAAFVDQGTEIVCVDPWDGAELGQYSGDMGHQLGSGVAYRVFRNTLRHLPKGVRVDHIVGTSRDVLSGLNGLFDIIYLDGRHLYAEVVADIAACDALLAPGGFLCGDDLEFQMHEIDQAAARANVRFDWMLDERTGQPFHPGVTLAVGEAFGPVSVYRGFWIVEKRADGYASVDLAGARGWRPRHWSAAAQERACREVAADGLLAEIV